jgi:phage terminase small subunit
MSSNNKKKPGTARQRRFAKLYAQGDKSATDAAIEAGYSHKSRHIAHSSASKLLANPTVQSLINQELNRAFGNVEQEASNVAREILLNPQEKTSDRIQILKWLKEVRDWSAPKKTAILKADISKKFKLPEE